MQYEISDEYDYFNNLFIYTWTILLKNGMQYSFHMLMEVKSIYSLDWMKYKME